MLHLDAGIQSDEAICRLVAEHYRLREYLPEVRIEGDIILVEFNESKYESLSNDRQRIVRLAEKGKYAEAKRLISEVFAQGSTDSEIYRIHGQILFDEGDFDEALNQFIEALKWNPENVSALIMVGNLHARQKKDIKTARVFFEQALAVNPDHVTALTNYGSVLTQAGHMDDARRYFERALEIKPTYAQANLGLAVVAESTKNLVEAFEHTVLALKQADTRTHFHNFLTEETHRLATEHASSFDMDAILQPLLSTLSERAGKPVRTVLDASISTPAKLEIAEQRGASEHIVRYKAQSPTLPHYLFHELMHLEFVIEARQTGRNKQFVSYEEQRERFMADAAPIRPKIEKEGLDAEVAGKFLQSIFLGINNQIFNAPIDLSIEHTIHSRYPQMRPIQMLALLEMQEVAIQGANLDQIRRITPPAVFAANVTMSLTHAMQIRDMFGIDHTARFNAKNLIKRATELYDEWKQAYATWKAGDEYDLIGSWAEKLGLRGYFVLREEQQISGSSVESILRDIQNDPYDLQDESKNSPPLKSETGGSIRMDVVGHCVEALRFMQGLGDEQIQEIGFEIALVGRQGFDSEDSSKRYRFAKIPERSFRGLEAIAWMYCFWQRIDPSVDVGADFGKEYAVAVRSFAHGNDNTSRSR
jgi:tetratricopeptide (TPR) repeat protein